MILLSTRTKEAIKTALAMAIAYAIALQMDWDRPYWAAFAVGMISLPAAGASLRKGVLRLLRRFFRQAGFLVSPPTLSLGQTTGAAKWWERLRYRNDLLAIPDQLGTWAAMVDQRKYVRGSPGQLSMLITRLHMLSHRLQEMFEARRNPQTQFLVDELSEDIRDWRLKMQELFQSLAEDPAAVNPEALQSRLDRKLAQFEGRIKEALNKAGEGQISSRESENFYRLLGAYRGVSEAAVAFAGVAGRIDWKPWYEERF